MRTLRFGATVALCSCAAGALYAQDSISAVPPVVTSTMTGTEADLPVDRIADLLALLPGVNSLNDGSISVRGAGSAASDAYLDGVPVAPGLRRLKPFLLGGSWFGATGEGVSLGTNGFDSLTLDKGTGAAEFASARGGIQEVMSRRARPPDGRHVAVNAGWATDAIMGTSHGLNLNRVTVAFDGQAGRFSANLAAVGEGQGSERLGLDQNASPVYVAAGVDTVVTVAAPGGSTTSVDVLKFTPSPGIRIPASATSNYSVLARLGYLLGEHQRLEVTAVASQVQARVFNYQSLYDLPNLNATRDWDRVLTGSWYGQLLSDSRLRLAGEAHLSVQTDRATDGPLDASSQTSTLSPWGGFLLAPLRFRFDGNTFPVNNQLVEDFRANTGRLSPYDLQNTAQYQLVSQWRTNAYGLNRSFYESGGPLGPLTLSQEDRVVGKIVLDGHIGEAQRVRIGGEVESYDIHYYSSGLISQAFSDAYVQSPQRAAVYGQYEIRSGQLTLSAGLRYDHFSTGAERPYYFADTLGRLAWFPRISTMPGFNATNPAEPAAGCTPGAAAVPVRCVNQYAGLISDLGHSRVSPRANAAISVSPRLEVRAAVTSTAQMPDLTAVYQGVNTDLAVTGSSQIYGSDLDYARSVLGEIGARYRIGSRTAADLAVWTRKDAGVVVAELRAFADPRNLSNTGLSVLVNGPDRTATGVDALLSQSLGLKGQAWVAYSYTHGEMLASPLSDVRPHSVTAALLYQTGAESRALGGLLSRVGMYVDARVASGTPYTPCPGPGCVGLSATGLNSARLPTTKVIDLRLSKGFSLAGTTLTAFIDARNLFNTENITQVFTETGTTADPLDHSLNLLGDRQAYAQEAAANGVLMSDSTINLQFAGQAEGGCGTWVNAGGSSATPNCVYLIRAEQRFGNGDHLFTVAEQTRASDALYQVGKGLQYFTAPGRLLRFGLEVGL
ncbi:MAG TPA: hypothetical protein VMG41_17080 [Gemmatimonadales bacterium]|nr:hypothetical protein [Gemmatimonadales bacterium]